jgi:uracil-DNA glycosylase
MSLTWEEFFSCNQNHDQEDQNNDYIERIDLRELITNHAWDDFFDEIEDKEYYIELEEELTKKICKEHISPIYPLPQKLFYPMNKLSPKQIKVVIIGQDPYFNIDPQTNEPQAMGLAFSVPTGAKIPASLLSIYNNLIKFKHMLDSSNSSICKPKTGNLKPWLKQGVFLFNASLTVTAGKPGSHSKLWIDFMEDLLLYLVKKNPNIIFVLWGKDALNVKAIIGPNHNFIISSHPSPLSNYKKMGNYPAFNDVDHFGLINKYLVANNMKPISWDKDLCY